MKKKSKSKILFLKESKKIKKINFIDIEVKLKESEEKFSMIFQSNSLAMAIVNLKDDRIIDVNEAFEKLIGYRRLEIIGRLPVELELYEDPHKYDEARQLLLTNSKLRDFEVRYRLKNGIIITCLLYADPIDLAGEPCAIINIIDISERKKVEEELRESTKRYQALVENSSDIITYIDRDIRYLFVNSAISQISTIKPVDFIGKTMRDVGFPKEQVDQRESMIRQVFSTGQPLETEVEHIGNNGWQVYEYRVFPDFDLNGNVQSVIAINRNITKRKLSDHFQKLSTKILIILNNTIDLHDTINNILNAIKQEMSLDAVGIRLQSGEDFPYFVQNGFSNEFLLTENSLTVCNQNGEVCRNKDGSVCLECICGLIISGHTDPTNPLFTKEGSAWTNNSLQLLKTPAINDPSFHPRNRCIHDGYLSVALIPIKVNQKIIGLLQLNNIEKNRFTLEMIRYFEDISASIGITLIRKQTEKELKESQALYYSFIEQLPNPVFRKNKEGRYVLVNSQFCRIKGLDKEEFIGRTPKEVADKQLAKQGENGQAIKYANIGEDTHEKIMQTGKIIEAEEEYPSANGTKQFLNVFRMPVFDSFGNIIGTQGILFDITERKLAEEALRESESKYRNLFNNVQVGMFRTKLDGSAILDFNDHYLKIFGRTSEEMKGVPSINFWVDLHEREEMVKMLKRDGKVNDFECKMWSKDGKVKNCLTSVRLYPEEEILEGSIINITERKLAEEKINKLNEELEERVAKRTEELVSVNKELEAFSYSVAHDLRAPLRAINGFSSFVLEDNAGKVDKETENYLNLIKTNTQKMDTLIYDLLELSKINRHEISFSKIDMNSMVNSIYYEIATSEIKESFIFKVNFLPDAYGDSHLMHQVWINLLSNALKYTMKSKIKRIEVNGYEEGNNNIYYVKDSGVGFNPEYKDKLFGVFQRLHTATEFEGTGIGLAIVQRIINRHKGKVWAEGEVNNGATFYFSLPNKEVDNELSK